MDRAAFLTRLRDRLAGAGGPDRALPATFPPTPASGSDASPERFLTALRAVAGDGAVVTREELVTAIARIAGTVPKDRLLAVVAPDANRYGPEIDEGLARAGLEIARPADGAGWREQAATAGLGVTSAVLGVCSTGSVLIGSGPDSPRAASILPDTHLVVLPADRLVAGLEEALEQVAGLASTRSNPFLVTGPSRTSDIEMEMVLGAHGPRAVHVLLVARAAQV